jgi:hypothetical protein
MKKKPNRTGNEAARGVLLFGMILSGFGFFMAPNIPVQDATRSQSSSFRGGASLIMLAIFVVCGIVRWQLAAQSTGSEEDKQE